MLSFSVREVGNASMNLRQIWQEVDLNRLLLRFGKAGSSSFLGDTGYTMMDPQVVLDVFEHVIIQLLAKRLAYLVTSENTYPPVLQ